MTDFSRKIAKTDVKSWLYHSYAQSNIHNPLLYRYFLHKFFREKIKVESAVFKITIKEANKTSLFLKKATINHDLAESLDDSRKDSLVYWEKVRDNLSNRFSIILNKNSTERIGNINKSLELGNLECLQWRSHHFKDYKMFLEVTKREYFLLGLDEKVALSSAELLIEACKVHDQIEEERDRDPLKKDDKRWDIALDLLAEHYELLIKYIR